MKTFLTKHIMLSIHLLVVALAVSIGAWVSHHDKLVVVHYIEDSIEEQTKVMIELAEVTGRNGADEVVARVIADCSRRDDYDKMLGNLDTLSPKELITMQQLFESCGSFFPERKALMVSRLEREYEVLRDDVLMLNQLTGTTDTKTQLESWKNLIELERKRSDGLTELTRIQRDIISALIRATPDSRKDIQKLVQDAQELSQLLDVMYTQVEDLRQTLSQ